jgi:hypothetical protein
MTNSELGWSGQTNPVHSRNLVFTLRFSPQRSPRINPTRMAFKSSVITNCSCSDLFNLRGLIGNKAPRVAS